METYRIKWLTRIVYSQTFELCIAGIIFLNAVALALLTIPGIDAATRESLERFDQAALWIFVAELVVRMIMAANLGTFLKLGGMYLIL
jgi:hypothetical protein